MNFLYIFSEGCQPISIQSTKIWSFRLCQR